MTLEIQQKITLKLNDYYTFRYNEIETKRIFEPYHCFDGKLIVKENHKKELILVDTYWLSSDNRTFTLERALNEGTLEFVCNLDDIEEIKQYELIYYADEDLFNLSYQHGCYKRYAKRKGALRSREKMLRIIKERISEAEYKLRSAQSSIEQLNKVYKEVEDGDINKIYI